MGVPFTLSVRGSQVNLFLWFLGIFSVLLRQFQQCALFYNIFVAHHCQVSASSCLQYSLLLYLWFSLCPPGVLFIAAPPRGLPHARQELCLTSLTGHAYYCCCFTVIQPRTLWILGRRSPIELNIQLGFIHLMFCPQHNSCGHQVPDELLTELSLTSVPLASRCLWPVVHGCG